jgi:hypothetical protein
MGEQHKRIQSCFWIMAKIDSNKILKILECTIKTMISEVSIFQSFTLNLISKFGDLISACLKA